MNKISISTEYNLKPLFALNFYVFKTGLMYCAKVQPEDIKCDILCLTYNCETNKQIDICVEHIKNLLPKITSPLIIRGCGNDDIDNILLPELIKILDRESIIATVTERNYQKIVPLTAKFGHWISIRTPIDINLAKEMNILASELGQPLNKILIDSDIGGLGYGLDYGYSMIEKIRLENEKYLNLPIISFAPEESLKTKEARSSELPSEFGKLDDRATDIEIASAAAVVAAGANVVVMNSQIALNTMKATVNNG